MSNAGVGWVVVWGWEATVDYRYHLSRDEVFAIGYGASVGAGGGDGDEEINIPPRRLLGYQQRIQAILGRPPYEAPGGSPFLSALALHELRKWNPEVALPTPAFCGIYPPGLKVLSNGQDWQYLLRDGLEHRPIRGSLCLEDLLHSRKRVLAAFGGRRLNSKLYGQLTERLSEVLEDHRDNPILLALGGLNKSHPRYLRQLAALFRRLRGEQQPLLIATNSFLPVLEQQRRDQLMYEYVELIRDADVVSLSAEELSQLGTWMGLMPGQQTLFCILQSLDLPGLVVCHHRQGAVISIGTRFSLQPCRAVFRAAVAAATAGVANYCTTGHTVLNQENDTATLDGTITSSLFEEAFGVRPTHPCSVPARPVGRALGTVGLGSRFDGYLTAMLAGMWHRLVPSQAKSYSKMSKNDGSKAW